MGVADDSALPPQATVATPRALAVERLSFC